MVTNERQRQYAIETRKSIGTGPNKRKISETETPARHCPSGPSDHDFNADVDEALFQHSSRPSGGVFTDGMGDDPCPGVADLGLISGLPQADWNVLVATVQEHFRYGHPGGKGCSTQCVNQFFHNVFLKDMGYLEKSKWSRAVSEEAGVEAKQEFAHEIVRGLFSAVARNLDENSQQNTPVKQHNQKKRKVAIPTLNSISTRASDCQRQRDLPQHTLAPSSHEAGTQTLTPPESSDLPDAAASSEDVRLQINIMKNEDRQHPPFHIYSKGCPDYESLCQSALRNTSRGAEFHIQALLATGLTPVSDDTGYASALEAVRKTVWMDGELKVLVFLS
ncbi:hypothetical protein GP486_003788 [Trichoglossum hirsutum]|uniref:Uncharacterized protein n=1 Tax=Trichoglossum hirsutum TaxID=265104 RepID=A0A9P8LC07_9PEZI|nr:hypothetical protein GP486_003788 [Trichoglossum hirsutum]